MKNETWTFSLTAENIDLISQKTQEVLDAAKVDKKNKVRLRLSIEEILICWMERFEDGAVCRCSTGRRMGRCYIALSVVGEKVNPYESDDTLEFGGEAQNSILSALGLSPLYQYVNGENRITLMPEKKKMNSLAGLGISVLLAVTAGFLVKDLLPAATGAYISDEVVGPVSDAFLRLLTAVVGPLMFLSTLWGMFNIGDTTTLGMIGKRMTGRFFAVIFILLAVFSLILVNFFPLSLFKSGGSNSALFSDIYKMLLEMVPSNIAEPFLKGNSLQIIFMAVVVGIAMLVLAKKTTVIAQLVEQSNFIVQLIMGAVTSVVPVFIFCTIFRMMMSNIMTTLTATIKYFVVLLSALLLILILFIISLSVRKKVNPLLVTRKLLPTFLIAITTASSSAAYATNVGDCVNKLGIDEKIVNFGVPLGSIMLKVGSGTCSLVLVMFMAELYKVPINIHFILLAVIIAGILSIATPPVLGGGLTSFTVLFAQLGIPSAAIAIAVACDALLDFPLTAVNITSLQVELAILADHLGMLDDNVLRDKQRV